MGLVDLLDDHKDLAESQDDKARLGMFYGWLGFSLFSRERFIDSYQYLRRALDLGEETESRQVIGYACTWLPWTCAELGRLDEAIGFGERAQEMARHIPSDQYLFFKSLGGIGFACCYKGDKKRAIEAGSSILNYGRRHSSIRSMVMGHWIMGFSFLLDGDFTRAIECNEEAIKISGDPYYCQFPRVCLGISHALNGQFQEAEEPLQEVLSFGRKFGCENLETAACAGLGLVLLAKGHMSQGLKMTEEARNVALQNRRKCWYAMIEMVLGQVYLQIVDKSTPISLSVLAKNVGFLLRNVPSAAKKAEDHFNKAIETAKEIEAKGILGQGHLFLGLLFKAKGRAGEARDCLSQAIQILEQCESENYLKQAKEALASFG
jgi:tetratricopeptide (TPR) repeat protein